MPLPIGTVFGSYEIVGLLGAGGMGEVYRARDRKLQRDVAVKVLATGLGNDPERLTRLEREARRLAGLNHPRIGAIYGLEEVEGVPALVLELVEGLTLAERLAQGLIPVHEAVRLARQIAEALEAAHDSGIIHRDLKPGNIKITPANDVKVLDFGIAKALPAEAENAGDGEASTVASDRTRDGVILGTAAYMSPEQARGQAVDKRTDIWAFGCVLYETLTGRKAFTGATPSDTLVAILEREPAWGALPPNTPSTVRRLLERCFEKDPRRRLRDIGDARIELDDLLDSSRHARDEGPELPTSSSSRHVVAWKIAAAAMAVIAVAALALVWRTTRPENRGLVRVEVDLGPDATDPASGPSVILSPDGTRLVYRRRGTTGVMQLVTRRLEQERDSVLAGTEGAQGPFFSPDSLWVGFFAGQKLKKISLQGGAPIDVADAPAQRGASWSDNGDIVAALTVGPLSRIPAGGSPQVLTELQREASHRWPQVVREAVVFTSAAIVGDFEHATIEIQSLKSGRRTTLVRDAYFGRYAESGHLLYVQRGTLFAAPLDLEGHVLTGPAVPVLERVKSRIQNGGAALDISRDGTLLYAQGDSPTQRLAWLDSTGRTEPLATPLARYDYGLRLSPDGKRIATGMAVAAFDVWSYELARDVATRLTVSPLNDFVPTWAPDGDHIAYQCTQPVEGAGSTGCVGCERTVPDPT